MVVINPETVRTLRRKRAWTQEQLAEVAGVSLRTVQRMENGDSISFASAKAVANALNVEIEDLLKSCSQSSTEDGVFLPRITSGNQLVSMLLGADFLQCSHDDLDTVQEVEMVSRFFDYVYDCDILDEVPPGERVRVAFELDQIIEELHNAGFWVFGKTVTKKYKANMGDSSATLDGLTATIRVVREASPEIVRKNTPAASLFASLKKGRT